EQFPGLVYRMRDPKTVVLIFGSGKIVIAGAKWEEQVPTVARRVMDRLLELDLTGTWEVEEDG
ncbi:MAG: TATA-box-binding protein, partial [Candidatus Thorarchaeota archaeon SMTZ1-83]